MRRQQPGPGLFEGEYGEATATSPGFDVVYGWNTFSRSIQFELHGTAITGSAPELAETYSRTVAENAAAGTAVGAPVTGTDPDDDKLTYMMDGDDAGAFVIDPATGQIRTIEGVFYDYEIKSAYTVTVSANDGNGNTDSAEVTIGLTDVTETLTGSFEGAPAAHKRAPFVLRLALSEPAAVDTESPGDGPLSVTNGRVTAARRLDDGRGLDALGSGHLGTLWQLTIEPTTGAVTVTLPATTDCTAEDAVCTNDDRPLSTAVTVTVDEGTVPAWRRSPRRPGGTTATKPSR